jgi:hypothetical protein
MIFEKLAELVLSYNRCLIRFSYNIFITFENIPNHTIFLFDLTVSYTVCYMKALQLKTYLQWNNLVSSWSGPSTGWRRASWRSPHLNVVT